ncbi:XRE family transcriptional regulator [Mycobacterium sp. PDNC021]|uniref:XRE family transcriptional regulator n=1 Tax=Mycobacterium sp. PDNC021 TaxID=3391399 RepID=UPI003AAC16AD
MAEPQKKNPLGPTGTTVADNIKRLRGDMQYVKLAARLEELGRPIPTLGLRKIESYERRVDADDLVALAVALDVSPITLLAPHTENRQDEVAITGRNHPVSAIALWHWLLTELPLPGDKRIPIAFQFDTRPPWWWQYQAEKDDRDHLERRAADRNLIESGLMSAEQLLAEGKSPDGDN